MEIAPGPLDRNGCYLIPHERISSVIRSIDDMRGKYDESQSELRQLRREVASLQEQRNILLNCLAEIRDVIPSDIHDTLKRAGFSL